MKTNFGRNADDPFGYEPRLATLIAIVLEAYEQQRLPHSLLEGCKAELMSRAPADDDRTRIALLVDYRVEQTPSCRTDSKLLEKIGTDRPDIDNVCLLTLPLDFGALRRLITADRVVGFNDAGHFRSLRERGHQATHLHLSCRDSFGQVEHQ